MSLNMCVVQLGEMKVEVNQELNEVTMMIGGLSYLLRIIGLFNALACRGGRADGAMPLEIHISGSSNQTIK